MTRRIVQVAAGVVLGLAVALFLARPSGPPSGPPDSADDPHLLPGPMEVPSARLVDEHGDTVAFPGVVEGVTAVFFGYTACPDVCPPTLAALAALRERLSPEEAARFAVTLVSVDPERDGPSELRRYLARFDSTFVGLTGDPETIREIAAGWGAWAAPRPDAAGGAAEPAGDEDADPADGHAGHGGEAARGPAGDGYIVDHTARVFLVDGTGRVVASFPTSTGPDAMLPTVRRLLEEAR